MAMARSIMVLLAGLSGVFQKTVPKFPAELCTTIRVCLPATRLGIDATKSRFIFDYSSPQGIMHKEQIYLVSLTLALMCICHTLALFQTHPPNAYPGSDVSLSVPRPKQNSVVPQGI